jgi:hypothetical protein
MDQMFIALYDEIFQSWTYQAFSMIGEISKQSGFRSHKTLVIMHIMHNDLRAMKDNGWMTDEKFGFKHYNEEIDQFLSHQMLNNAMEETKSDSDADTEFYDEQEAAEVRENQRTKVNLVFKIAYDQLEKHFVPTWLNSCLLLCALGEEGNVGRCIAELLVSGGNAESCLPSDLVHLYDECGRREEISILDFRKFVVDRCSNLDEIRELNFVKNNKEELQLIVEGTQLSQDPQLRNLFQYYKEHFAVVPSTNQFTELMFKRLSDISSVHNRSEQVKSFYLVIISVIQPNAKDKAWQIANERAKKEGKDLNIEVKDVRGSALVAGYLHRLMEVLNTVDNHENSEGYKEQLLENFSDKKKTSKRHRAYKKVSQHIYKNLQTTKELNVRAKVIGFETTDSISGKLRFSSISRDHKSMFHEELVLHGIEPGRAFGRKTKMTDLKGLLRNKLGLDDSEKSFRPKYRPLFEACSITVSRNLSEAGEVEEEGHDDDDDIFCRFNVCQTKVVKLSSIQVKKNGLHLMQKELEAHGIDVEEHEREKIKSLKIRLQTHLNPNARAEVKTIRPKSQELKEAIEKKWVEFEYVDDLSSAA